MNLSTKKMTTIGMLCALAMICNLLIHFPIVPAVSFLSYDPKDILIVIGGFIYGPMASFVMSAICSVLEIALKGGNFLDVLMDMISTCAFACVAAFIYKRKHTKEGAIIGLSIGMIITTVCMLLWNYIVTPIYYGIPHEAVVPMLLPGILPFNLIKSGLNAALTMFLYKPVMQVLRHTNLVDKSHHQNIMSKGYFIVGIFILVSIILLIMVLQGII